MFHLNVLNAEWSQFMLLMLRKLKLGTANKHFFAVHFILNDGCRTVFNNKPCLENLTKWDLSTIALGI